MFTRRRLPSLLACLALLAIAAAFLFLAYRRIGLPLPLLQDAAVVDGVIAEKLIQPERASPLPFEVSVFRVRYTYPNLQGQMRTGEQVVTRAAFARLGDQGAPVQVTIHPDDEGISAVDPRITFPGVAGVRLALAMIALLAGYFVFLLGILTKPDREASRR